VAADDHRGGKTWTFLTNHARVLIRIAREPDSRIRDIADFVGITERAAQLIVADLEEEGYLTHTRVGRRNVYTVNPDLPFRHPAEGDHGVKALIALFTENGETRDDVTRGEPPHGR
jgi:DNA-binding Lrp family transcriptional regulator